MTLGDTKDAADASSLSPVSPVSPVAPFPPAPAPHKRSRAPEFYGFVAWTSTSLCFVLYLLWGLLPDEYIAWLGVEWYPSREWALLLPAWSMVVVLLTYFTYFALAISATVAFSDINAVEDSKASLPTEDRTNPYIRHALDTDAYPELYDIPLGLVNRVVYKRPREIINDDS